MVTPETAVPGRRRPSDSGWMPVAPSRTSPPTSPRSAIAREWFSRLGADALGDRVLAQLSRAGIDTSRRRPRRRPPHRAVREGSRARRRRTTARARRPRTSSPADADALSFDGVDILHVSGITAAISASAAAFLDRVIDRAHEAGVPVSFDVNHRAALWERRDRRPRARRARAPRRHRLHRPRRGRGALGRRSATTTSARCFPDVPELVVKDGDVGATAYRRRPARSSSRRCVVEVVEAVGAGDAFAGGYLAARLSGERPDERLRAGHRRAALTLRTTGDFVEEGIAAMTDSDWFEEAFAGAPLMAILRGMGVERSARLATTAWDLGLDSVEVPLQTDEDERRAARGRRASPPSAARSSARAPSSPPNRSSAAARRRRRAISSRRGSTRSWCARRRSAASRSSPVSRPRREVQLGVSLGLTWLKAFPAEWLGVGLVPAHPRTVPAGAVRRDGRPRRGQRRRRSSTRACASRPSARRSRTRRSSTRSPPSLRGAR